MDVDLGKLYTSNERKKITERLKRSKDLGWFSELLKISTSSQLLYLSEPLTECFKSKKLTLDVALVQLIVQSLDRNCQNMLTNSNNSLEEVTLLSVSCHGLHLFLKSKLSDTFDISHLNATSKQLMSFLLATKQLPRDVMILIIPLVIFVNIKYHNSSPKTEHEISLEFFSGNQYLIAWWKNCLLKSCKFSESDQEVLLMMLQESVEEVKENVVWYQFVHLDSIRMCLRKHRCFEFEEIVPEVFDLVTLFYDDRGLNVSNVCEDIIQLCLTIEPELIQRVKDISLGPWYSRKTISFLNLFLSESKFIETAIVSSTLKSLVSRLGYNRLDHNNLKAIKTLLRKNMCKENFVTLLRICVSCVGTNPVFSRILSDYMSPFFTKREIFPDDLKENVFKLIDSCDIADQGKVFLFETFYPCFKEDLHEKLLSSQLNRSSSSEVQSSLITLISRNMQDFTDNDFIVTTYKNLLTIPCPTVRVHAIASFQSLKPFVKSNNQTITLLLKLFLENTYIDAPYHSIVTALNFFLQSNLDKENLTVLQRDKLQEQILELMKHNDNDVCSLAKKINKHFFIKEKSNEHDIKDTSDTTDLLTSFMDEIEKVTGLQNILQTDIPSKVSPLKTELSNMSTQNIVSITRVSICLINILLDMISHRDIESDQVYTAPSFEETFVIIQTATGGDETFCKNAGQTVWNAIASLLELLSGTCGALVDSTMEGYLIDGNTFVSDLYSIGDVCLKCVFRCRHRSVIKASCETLKVISVRTSPHPPTHELPSRWVTTLLNVLHTPTSSSLSRRSAGLPEAIEAVLQCNNLHLTHDTVTKLLEAANIPYPEECTETEDLVQVHSLHMLRLVLSSAKLRHHLIPFSDQVCKLCYTGFIHSFWVVRNASFLLFAELLNYILGHLNSEFDCGYRSSLSIGELQQHYRGIYQQVLSNLQKHSSGTKTCPTIFLSLMISSKLYPDTTDTDDILGECLYNLLSSPIYKIRSVAARTVVLVCHKDKLREFVRRGVQELRSSSDNKVNGVLMFILESSKGDGDLVECDVIEGMTEILNIEKMLDINISLVLQIYVALRRKDGLSDAVISKVLEVNEHGTGSQTYPSSILDYLGVWFIVIEDYRSVFAHIQNHCPQLTEIFWNSLNDDFYTNVDYMGLIWLLDGLTNQEYRYVSNYLANCVFEIINKHSIIPDFTVPPHILTFLSDNTSKYAHICMILDVTYNISTNHFSLLQTLDQNLRFDTCNIALLSCFYKIQKLPHNVTLTATILASALLHCQSENEELRQLATRFCVFLPTRVSSLYMTARHAMECGVGCVKVLLANLEEQDLWINAVRRVRERVVSENCEGFDINSNAHFDKRLFLSLVDV